VRLLAHLRTALFVCAISVFASAPRAEVVVVVASNSPVETLSADEIATIFLGKTASYPNGLPAVPVDQPEGARVREEFYSRITGKTAAQLKAYWSRIIFSGRGEPPRQAGDSAGVKKVLQSNPNAIGYIDPSSIDAAVKVIYPR